MKCSEHEKMHAITSHRSQKCLKQSSQTHKISLGNFKTQDLWYLQLLTSCDVIRCGVLNMFVLRNTDYQFNEKRSRKVPQSREIK